MIYPDKNLHSFQNEEYPFKQRNNTYTKIIENTTARQESRALIRCNSLIPLVLHSA